VVYVCNPNSEEAEAGASRVQGQLGYIARCWREREGEGERKEGRRKRQRERGREGRR
jgi:hypothetical protein